MFSFSGVAFGSGGPDGMADILVDFDSVFCGHVNRASGCIGSLPWSVLPYAGLCDLKKKKKKKKKKKHQEKYSASGRAFPSHAPGASGRQSAAILH